MPKLDPALGCPECGAWMSYTGWPSHSSPVPRPRYGKQCHYYVCLCGASRRQGVYHRPRPGARKGGTVAIFNADEVRRIIEMYTEAHMSCLEIGNLMICHKSTIKGYLKREGVTLRKRGGSKPLQYVPHREIEQIKFLYHGMKMSLKEIQVITGWHPSTTRNRLIKSGIPLRTSSEQSKLMWEKKRSGQLLTGKAARDTVLA